MNTLRKSFFDHLAQTSDTPPALEIKSAKGVYLYGANKKYLDLISGIAVSNLGHGNKKIIGAIKKQLDLHAHLMVYGEFILSPQTEYAELLT
ncbi:MAG TPA: aminotransferase class III-fold pyridoxal phosphate-dependent enzyme, partial [Bacteroidia bacterium]